MIHPKLFSILQSPDDGTPINPDLMSESGSKYEMTKSGILIIESNNSRVSDIFYDSPMFRKWNAIIAERIQYYTKKQTIAGSLAHQGYRRIGIFNDRSKDDWILDIGCGDGAQAGYLKDRSSYIGIDRNMDRLEILKRNYPEAIAIYADVMSLPFKTNTFKYVFSTNAFEHIWYLKDAMLELFRCMDQNGLALIIIPTEGGLWNIGRKLLSKPYFQRKYPEIDFEFISHVEHCNEARQVIRTLETLFYVQKRYKPTRIPTMMINAFVEIYCRPKNYIEFSTNSREYEKF